jgi:hypothetical protein
MSGARELDAAGITDARLARLGPLPATLDNFGLSPTR